MANGLLPLAGLCALLLVCASCSADPDPGSSLATRDLTAGSGGVAAQPAGGKSGASVASGGTAASTVNTAKPSAGESGAPPPPVDGRSVYALECHGDSKDCNLATVPCFGVSSQTPNAAAGWACANRCASNADCSNAPSGSEAQASCVPFVSAGHCMLVCRNENQSFTCPDGMTCQAPPKSALGYCLWQ